MSRADPATAATPGSRGLHALERCASRRSRRSWASVRAAMSWSGTDHHAKDTICFGSSPKKARCEAAFLQDGPDRPLPNQVVSTSRIAHPPPRDQRRASRITVKVGSSHKVASAVRVVASRPAPLQRPDCQRDCQSTHRLAVLAKLGVRSRREAAKMGSRRREDGDLLPI